MDRKASDIYERRHTSPKGPIIPLCCCARSKMSADASMTFLTCRSLVTALAWSPSGHLLASASEAVPGFAVWDVAAGVRTPLSAGERLTFCIQNARPRLRTCFATLTQTQHHDWAG